MTSDVKGQNTWDEGTTQKTQLWRSAEGPLTSEFNWHMHEKKFFSSREALEGNT